MSTSNGATRQDDYMAARHAMVRDQLEARGMTDVRICAGHARHPTPPVCRARMAERGV